MAARGREDDAYVMCGNRFHGGPRRVLHFSHYGANRMLSLLNLLTGRNVADMEVGYQVLRRDVLPRLTSKSKLRL